MLEHVKHISAFDEPPASAENKPRDVGDPSQLREAVKDAKQARASRADIVKWVMSHKNGRQFIYELLASCSILHNPFNKDAIVMSFSCGEMNIGLPIFGELQENCPDLYVEMMNEAKERSNG